jgi:hypothetical protein
MKITKDSYADPPAQNFALLSRKFSVTERAINHRRWHIAALHDFAILTSQPKGVFIPPELMTRFLSQS